MLGRDVHGAVEPVEDEVQCAAWHLSSHLARLNVDGGAVLIVAHVEVRRIVVEQIHRDNYSVEVANLWHNLSRFVCLRLQRYTIFQKRVALPYIFNIY